MIRVLVAASSAVVRGGLEAVVQASEQLEFAGSVAVGELRDEEEADVVLIASANADEELLRTCAESPCPALLLTDEPEIAMLSGSLRGVLRFDAKPEEIGAALVAVSEGLVVMHPASLDRRPVALMELDEPLTPRETEVLRMLAEGLSNKLIAYRLEISEHTVKFHMTQVLAKLRASSRTDAVMQGIRRGLVLI